jgi:N-carbamoyl-L-amino-acid hydrolase
MEEAGLTVRRDTAANIIGELKGTRPELSPLLVGSHTDTVPDGGRFDGIAGVLAGIEIAKVLSENGIRPERTLLIADFTAEEPTEFGISTVGSKAMAGGLSPEMLALKDHNGRTLAEAIDEAGGSAARIGEARLPAGGLRGALELHIEQGPVMEKTGKLLGAVTGIVGIKRMLVSFTGRADHAGTTPMDARLDALTGGAEAVLALEGLCGKAGNAVGTVGKITVQPNAANVVAGRTELNAEVRSLDPGTIESLTAAFSRACGEIARRRGLGLTEGILSHTKPVASDPELLEAVRRSCLALTDRTADITSGAGHDMNQMALVCPVGMVFIPCRAGRSHAPEEWCEPEHLGLGVAALLGAVLGL